MTYPHAWRYRDYVIDSFNEDKPYDQFVREQLAGDLLPVETDQEWADNLIATGFLAIGTKNVNEQNGAQFAVDLVDEQINATTRVFLGKSVACARCHDHKFDAITQKDYYALAGIFGSTSTFYGNPPSEAGRVSTAQQQRNSSLLMLPINDPNPYDKHYTEAELSKLNDEIQSKRGEMLGLRNNMQSGDSNAENALRTRLRLQVQLATLTAKLAVVDKNGNPNSYCMGVQDLSNSKDAKLLVRGEIDAPADTVPRGFPQVLSVNKVSIGKGSGRLELADWIASEDNPLTARVMVNRIWKHLIGQGIVTTTEDFGVSGKAPTHPELLDYLAIRFVESGWSVKSIIREITTSRIYRASSVFNKKAHEYDPENTLLWRANPRRLDAESMRDAMLHISGEIDLERPRGSEVAKAGYVRVRDGSLASVTNQAAMMMQMKQRMQRRRPGITSPGITTEYTKSVDIREMADAKFRSAYLPMIRDEIPRALKVFDFPDSSLVTGSRETSNTAIQALYMMNNPFVIQQSEAFADRLTLEEPKLVDQLERAFVLAFSRSPTIGEQRATEDFMKNFGRNMSDEKLLSVFCQSLYSSAEFRYID